MTATPPEANTEYSRAQEASRALLGIGAAVPIAVFAGAVLGAVLLVVAEFTTLFTVTTLTRVTPVASYRTGSHHSYALIPVGVFAAVLAFGAWRYGSRPALLALGLLGVLALVIALVGDLPDAHASGLIATGGRYADASSRPDLGLYLETLGGAVLIMSCGVGFLLGGPPPAARRRRSGRRSTRPSRPRSAL
jgi:hypothetical protein